ncbi:MAG: L-aspartate oxidase [Sarcina sp.]
MVYDVIIVGTGVAGLFAALNLKKNLKILVVTKKEIKDCNSYLAQGGVSVLRDSSDFDSFLNDTLKAGQYKNDVNAVSLMINSSREVINDLINLGVEFDSDENGLKYTREGAHSEFRIVHNKDLTGKEIIDKLVERVLEKDNIEIKENTIMTDLIIENDECKGIKVLESLEEVGYYAKNVIIATGGIGGMFENSTNYRHITGDGINIALNNGIECKDLNYIQVHPTALVTEDSERRFLISESLRGEGAYLLNKDGERFVDELLPRDVVSKAIYEELEKTGESNVYLSFNHKGVEFVEKRFPNIFAKCKECGYILGQDLIPVAPAQHYFMGGIKINKNGKTSLKNLYAAGETSCVGIHGANRLASNSLLEGLVFSKRVAKNINLRSVISKEEEVEVKKLKDLYEKELTDRFVESYKVQKVEMVKIKKIPKNLTDEEINDLKNKGIIIDRKKELTDEEITKIAEIMSESNLEIKEKLEVMRLENRRINNQRKSKVQIEKYKIKLSDVKFRKIVEEENGDFYDKWFR